MQYIFISLLSLSSFLPLQETGSIHLTFTNIQEAKGQIMVALNDTKGEMIEGYLVPVTKTGSLNYTIENVAPGKYTMAFFHDINKDEELNTNMVGIPKEPYAFSNNARGTFGPPSLEDQTFTVKGDVKMTIELK